MMKYVMNTLWSITAIGISEEGVLESPNVLNGLWTTYGYIVISVVLLVVVAIVLAKNPARKQNE